MTGPTRIAMVAMHSSPLVEPGHGDSGGMTVVIRATALELAARGVAVDVIARATGQPRVVSLADGVTVHELAAGPSGPLSKDRLAEASDEFGEGVAELARAGAGYDLLHAHYWRSGIAALPVALELGIPLVQSFHTVASMKNSAVAPGEQPEPEVRVRSEMFLAQQANAIIASSSAEVASLIDRTGAPAGRVWVVPPGVDSELFTPGRAIAESSVRLRLGVPAERPLIVVAGRVQPLKGQDLALQALLALPPGTATLVVVGEAPAGAESFLANLRQAATADVVFTGALEREDLADLFAAASLVLVPSHSETFGLVALEAAASGTPVLATVALGRSGAVDPNVSGILLGSRDPAEWAHAIGALLADGTVLAELSASARNRAEGFSWASSAASLLGVYASLGGR
jgi:D-inositol-3-phosphate glycosyltransferase